MGLHAMHHAPVGEEEQVGVGGRVDQMLDHVVLPQLRRLHSPAAATLQPVGSGQHRLHVAAVAHRHDQFVVGDQVLEREIALVRDDPRSARLRVLLANGGQLVFDDRPPASRIGEDGLQFGDQGVDLGQFGTELLGFQGCEPAQRHVEDRVGLNLAEFKALDEGGARLGRVRGAPDDPHDLVDVVDGDDEAFEDVRPGLGLVEPELGPPLDDLHLVIEVVADQLGQVERPRDAVDQRHRIDTEVLLQLGQLEQLVHDHLWDGVLLQLDHEPGAHPRR